LGIQPNNKVPYIPKGKNWKGHDRGSATLRNFIKSLKAFCDCADLDINWKKVTKGLPKATQAANDRTPTIEEIRKIVEYPDRRIKPIVYTMASSGIRLVE
jgi:hypothetical protein